jgi:hypothetical protein
MKLSIVKQHAKLFVITVLVLTLAGIFAVRSAFAGTRYQTIHPVGIVAANGQHVTLTGPIAVTADERAELRVTVSQRSTGAMAEGVVFLTGTGLTNQWEVTAAVQGQAAFAAGPATAVALARTTVRGQATDAHQWLVNITLVQE